jgi:hypothetical protein
LQDTSNSDVFRVSVKHEKAAESLQRRKAEHRSPLSIRRLHQDECREPKRRGLNEISNRNGRVLRGELVDETLSSSLLVAELSKLWNRNCCLVKDPVKVGDLFRQEDL